MELAAAQFAQGRRRARSPRGVALDHKGITAMSRHAHGHGRQTTATQARDEGEPQRRPRTHRHSLPHHVEMRDDGWRKHPARSLDADLALLPIWRSPADKR
jgi:hypothetical protein